MSQEFLSLDDFNGTARLFPLPNLVVFPHVVQPLHIFESRYVEMLEHAVADDHLLAMALLLPGWEAEYDGRPAIDPYVCLGRIMSHAPAKDNRYNILLGGIARAKVVEELPVKHSYREAKLEILEDIEPDENDPDVARLHGELVEAFRRFVPEEVLAEKQLSDVLDKHTNLGTLTDLVSYSLPLELSFRQFLLAEIDVLQRTRMLLDQLIRQGDESNEDRKFPPDFSDN